MSASGIVGPVSGPFRPGFDPRRGRNGGRPAKLAEIEAMLDEEHRTAAKVREVFAQLYVLATEPVISVWTDEKGQEHQQIRQPHPAFMKMYLDRVLGPVTEDNSEKVQRLVAETVKAMVAEARAARTNGG